MYLYLENVSSSRIQKYTFCVQVPQFKVSELTAQHNTALHIFVPYYLHITIFCK